MKDLSGRATHSRYDYVVVGSGSAGSVMAARLAEDPGARVLLLEAGPADTSMFIRMPAALAFPLQDDKYNWNLYSEPEPELHGRSICEARGRVLGGSSSINGMNWVRGNPWDYDNWAALGNEGWSFEEVLPYFKKLETYDKGANRFRGGSGPMKIETCAADGPLYRAFLAAGQEAGHVRVDDANGFRQEGVHVTQRNVHQGLRWSTSRAYLHSKGPRDNLHVLIKSRARKIVFDGRRAVKIEIEVNGKPAVIGVEREVVVCGGALHSPHLLLHSGVGNFDLLRKLGVPQVAHLPGVGEGLKDHIAAPVTYQTVGKVSAAAQFTLMRRALLGANWLFFKKGLCATNFFEVGAFIRTRDDIAVPDVQFEFIPFLGDFQHGKIQIEDGFQYFFSLLRPTSVGKVWIDSVDPKAPPKFRFNYLSTDEDRRDAIAAVRAIRKVVAQPAWAAYRGNEVLPGQAIQTDAEILDFLRKNAGTNYHPCCSCRMGKDDMAVVDAQARVHQLENVRIVDASIMPEIVSGNLNAPIIMMAEKVADLMRNRRLPAEDTDYYKGALDRAG